MMTHCASGHLPLAKLDYKDYFACAWAWQCDGQLRDVEQMWCSCVCGNQHTTSGLPLFGASGLVNLRVFLCVCVCGWLTRSSMSPCAADILQECFLFHTQKDGGLYYSFLSPLVLLCFLTPLLLSQRRRKEIRSIKSFKMFFTRWQNMVLHRFFLCKWIVEKGHWKKRNLK